MLYLAGNILPCQLAHLAVLFAFDRFLWFQNRGESTVRSQKIATLRVGQPGRVAATLRVAYRKVGRRVSVRCDTQLLGSASGGGNARCNPIGLKKVRYGKPEFVQPLESTYSDSHSSQRYHRSSRHTSVFSASTDCHLGMNRLVCP